MNMEKRREMVYKEVLASGALLWDEVQREVIEIEEKSKTAADPIQFILDERNKITFKGSEFGQRYIDFHYKELGDIEQMARTIADYYWLKIERQIKKKEERHETIDVEEMLCSYHEEIDDFLKNYLLRQSLLELKEKADGIVRNSYIKIKPEHRREDFIECFGKNEKKAQAFLKELTDIKAKGDIVTADLAAWKYVGNGGVHPGQVNKKALYEVLSSKGLDIVSCKHRDTLANAIIKCLSIIK